MNIWINRKIVIFFRIVVYFVFKTKYMVKLFTTIIFVLTCTTNY